MAIYPSLFLGQETEKQCVTNNQNAGMTLGIFKFFSKTSLKFFTRRNYADLAILYSANEKM